MSETPTPCPFCGAMPHPTAARDDFVQCRTNGCVMRGVWVRVAAWNRRAEPVEPVPTPERLEAWAMWFQDPAKSPRVILDFGRRFYRYRAAGPVLRHIAQRLRALGAPRDRAAAPPAAPEAQEPERKTWPLTGEPEWHAEDCPCFTDHPDMGNHGDCTCGFSVPPVSAAGEEEPR